MSSIGLVLTVSADTAAEEPCRPAALGGTVDPAEFGFSPDAAPETNAKALQKALDGGRKTVRVARPGVYGLDRNVYIDSDTVLEFAPGTVLRKTKPYQHVLVNRGAYSYGCESNIVVRNLEVSVNKMEAEPDPDSNAPGLNGHVSFYRVKNVECRDFRCNDFERSQYCLHVVDFDGFVIDGFVMRGGKDGVHLNRGRNFVVRNGVLRTGDDGIAVNAVEWPGGFTPVMGSIEDGLVENIVDEDGGKCNFARVITGCWKEWHPGMKLQRCDIFTVGKNVYTVFPMPLGTNEYVSLTAPTHRHGVWKSPDGINFLFLQDDGETRADIACEGSYGGHLQGVATDGKSLFWSFTVSLVKTDMTGKALVSRQVPTHHGDLCCLDGVVYVAVNRGMFNQESSAASEVRAYDCETLEPVGKWDLPDMPHGAGGITYRGGRFYVIGGLPANREQNYVYEYSRDFKLMGRHDLDTGFTLMGIQTAEYDEAADRFLFGIYGCKGNPAGVLAVDSKFSAVTRHVGPGNVGLLHVGGRLYVGGTCRQKEGDIGWIAPAPPQLLSGDTRYVPARSDGRGCVRFFFEGRHGADWYDAGYVFGPNGYVTLPWHDAAFVPAGKNPGAWPAVGIGGSRPMSVPDLVRGVRRAAECGETLSFHLPGDLPDLQKDAALAEAVAAIRREAAALGVDVR